jgi:hypothetical protein
MVMTNFSATDAAFSGFRFIGKRPGFVLAWAVVYALYQLSLNGLLVGLMGDRLVALQALNEINRSDPAAALAVLPSVGLLLLITLPLVLALGAVTNVAAFRALLGLRGGVLARLGLGADQVRMAGLILLWIALIIGYAFLVIFIFALLTDLGGKLEPAFKPIYFVALAAGFITAFVYPAVRLSLSGPMTVAEGRIRIFESWGLTRGRFWPLLGAYFLCWVMLFVLVIVGLIVVVISTAGVVLATSGSLSGLSGVFVPDYSSLGAYFSPVRLIPVVMDAMISAAALAIAAGPSAEAYRVFSGPKTVEDAAPVEIAPALEPEPEPSPYALEPAPVAETAVTEPWWKTEEAQAPAPEAVEPAATLEPEPAPEPEPEPVSELAVEAEHDAPAAETAAPAEASEELHGELAPPVEEEAEPSAPEDHAEAPAEPSEEAGSTAARPPEDPDKPTH